jgi:hypothetical protein
MAPFRSGTKLGYEIRIHVLVLVGGHDQTRPIRDTCVIDVGCVQKRLASSAQLSGVQVQTGTTNPTRLLRGEVNWLIGGASEWTGVLRARYGYIYIYLRARWL